MKKVYPSKIGVWLMVILITATVPGFYAAIAKQDYAGLPVLIIVTIFVVHLIATTRYTIDGIMLRVQSGFIVNKKVSITTISKVVETYNPISSPAASLDRLQVYYNNGTVIISPKDKAGFIGHLQSVNPNIVFVPRNKKG
ncbi:hypothetical protein Q765_15155 [Flavobacterium rivuli WB 3.3-2 = DSM 21788]|uniref:Uncharacterized protein YyaB-like PH domain-containing protein n=1 Tax=Flavobacterium rivuli WB 3.3-2 = DSM 21788 TaxID=1121895 RepID=A0A0A2M247_9FLAO|nr:PH domain-containing protein [Flavobacterium rivuli]KGO85548.1 hypothetical protein Q765_15155 [Flavobacterium rivuli WB 3.3-2 = DSM 21788]